jgi:hypothetical protein
MAGFAPIVANTLVINSNKQSFFLSIFFLYKITERNFILV